MRRRILPLLILVLISIPSVASTWVEVRSRHFQVVSDAGESQARAVTERFEQMRGVFGTMFHKRNLNSPQPLQIVVFRNQDEFMRFVPMWKGKPVSLTGFFQGSDDKNFIGIEMSSSDPFGTVCHEYAHLLLRNNFPVMPLWFEEGFAEYFATLKVNRDQVEIGSLPAQYAALLTSTQWMPITALLSVQHNSDAYNENHRRSMFYAESWLAVDYLLSKNRLVDAFKYLHLTEIENVAVPEAMQQAFGMTPEAFTKALRDHLASHPAATRMPVPELIDRPYNASNLNDLQAATVLADMHAHSKDHAQEALAEFQAILQKDPANTAANRGLGYWYLSHDQYDEAAHAFQKAVVTNDEDAQLHYLVAYLMNRKALKTGSAPDNPMVMRRELERAIQLDASIADAHNLLAFALAADNKFDMAIQAEIKAIELNPSAEMYQANLAHLYIKAERWDDAEAVLKRLQTASDPKVRDNATENLAALKKNQEMAAEQKRARAAGVTDPTAPQWKLPSDMKSQAQPEETDAKPDTRKTLYMYGQLESVDCSRDPAAVLTVREGPKLMKLRTSDYRKLIVMGADEFSCDWRGKKVLVNYKATGKSDGDLVTLEVQQGR
ncbi:MAG: tetratricopeptide repeat protein [Terriglobales bacterium]